MAIKRQTTIDDDGVVVDSKDFKYTIFDNDKGYLFKNKAFYVKSFQEKPLSETVKNKADYANIHLLAENVYKDTNMICVKRNRKVYPAEINDMQDIVSLGDRRFKEFLDRMIQLGIIAKVTINTEERIQIQYHLNPLYFMSSKYLSPALYMMFRKQLDKYLPAWVVSKFNRNERR